jgi:Domain of unknown function (DUF2828)
MFTNKQKPVSVKVPTTSAPVNGFLSAAKKETATTVSGNGAKKYSETNNPFVTQFGSIGSYRTARSFQDISNNQATLWAINPLLTVCFTLYLRIITRVVQLFNGTKTETAQRGAGLKHESIMRMIWLGVYHPNTFTKNLHLFISVGSWKDVIQMLSYDIQYNGFEKKTLDWNFISNTIAAGLENESTRQLVLKYLPQIKARSACKTIEAQSNNQVAKFLCFSLLDSGFKKNSGKQYAQYRRLKSSGTAHHWQQQISRNLMKQINFDTIHGRALAQLVGSKFIANNGLQESYAKWIASKPAAKFTGYVYELASKIATAGQKYQIDTINAQFEQLLATAGKSNSNFIVVKDTSGSMDSQAVGTTMSAYHIAKSMSIFMARMLTGYFNGHYIDFSSKAILRPLQGINFYENWTTEKRQASADTNLLSVANLFVDIRKQGIPENEFPNGIVCLSDGQFNVAGMVNKTNIDAFKEILATVFSADFINNFTFVFWDIRNNFYAQFRNTQFETHDTNIKNVFYFGGFDPSVITFLTGVEEATSETKTPTTATELFEAAMSQEILRLVEV